MIDIADGLFIPTCAGVGGGWRRIASDDHDACINVEVVG